MPGTIHATSTGTDFGICRGRTRRARRQHREPAPALPGRHPRRRRRPLHFRDVDRLRVRTPSWSSTRRPTSPSTRAGCKAKNGTVSADGRRAPRDDRGVARLRGEHRRRRGHRRPGSWPRRDADRVPSNGAPRSGGWAATAAAGAGHAGGCAAGRGRHGARARHPRLHPRLRGREQQHGDPAALLHHRHVVGPGRLDPAVGPHPRRGLDGLRLALPAPGRRPGDPLGPLGPLRGVRLLLRADGRARPTRS